MMIMLLSILIFHRAPQTFRQQRASSTSRCCQTKKHTDTQTHIQTYTQTHMHTDTYAQRHISVHPCNHTTAETTSGSNKELNMDEGESPTRKSYTAFPIFDEVHVPTTTSSTATSARPSRHNSSLGATRYPSTPIASHESVMMMMMRIRGIIRIRIRIIRIIMMMMNDASDRGTGSDLPSPQSPTHLSPHGSSVFLVCLSFCTMLLCN
jgi:hypothetical protein